MTRAAGEGKGRTREDWYRPRVQGHECEGYRTPLPPGRANLSGTVRRHARFSTLARRSPRLNAPWEGVADGASGFHGNAASTAPTLRTRVVPTRVESVATRGGGSSDGGAERTKGDGNRPSGTVTVGASPFDAACRCVLFYGVIEKNLPRMHLINVISLDRRASTAIDTRRSGGGGGSGDGDIVTRKGHRPAPQTDCHGQHMPRYPKHVLTSGRKINPEILQQRGGDLRIYMPPREVSGRRHAPCNQQLATMNYRRPTRGIAVMEICRNFSNFVQFSQSKVPFIKKKNVRFSFIEYKTMHHYTLDRDATDRVNAPVYYRNDTKQERIYKHRRRLVYPKIRQRYSESFRRIPLLEWHSRPSLQRGAPAPDPRDVTRNERTLRIFSGRLHSVSFQASGRPHFWRTDFWPVHGPRAVCVPYTGCAFDRAITRMRRLISA
ncbi:hypothetical protein X777_02061 [Ooceraea biroi]|uniref:Uncharacterized protein n=1 Tax=Ooceraea biroi TaxID=2015173 RepID=A0A026WN83_OOCBI|nr:hypothetical protein X777_02061 [Ooceraea biroi]